MQEEMKPLFETMMTDGARSVGAGSCTLWILDSDGEHLWSKVQQGAPPEQKLRNLFDAIVADTDHSGDDERYITASELEAALAKLGWHTSQHTVEKLIERAANAAHRGALHCEPFCELMTSFMMVRPCT